MSKIATTKLAEQAAGVKYSCFMDAKQGLIFPDCVHDYSHATDCDVGPKHRTREACKYWRPSKTFPHKSWWHRFIEFFMSDHS